MDPNVHYPPNEFWFQRTPDFAGDVTVVYDRQEGYERRLLVLFKYEGRWFAHHEAVWRFGGGGDGGHYDELLPDATDGNILQYAEKLKAEDGTPYAPGATRPSRDEKRGVEK